MGILNIFLIFLALLLIFVYKSDWKWCNETRKWIEMYIFGRRWF